MVGEARFDGILAWSSWPREQVAHLLPPGLRLAIPASGPQEQHPVLLVMGRQYDTAVIYGGIRLAADVTYDESMLAVPFVCRVSRRRLHTFVALMLSGDRRATWSGNVHYGFAKRPGRCDRFGDVVAGVADDVGLVMSAALRSDDASAVGMNGETPAVAIPRLFEAPVIGQRVDGSFVASYFTWDLGDAVVRPRGMRVLLGANLGLLPSAVEVGPQAGLQVRGMVWRLGWPDQPLF